MNNSCPNCGAVYNVAAKDIGRRIRCKKCQTPLTVTENGLEVDQPVGSAAMPAAPAAGTFEDMEDDIAAARKPKAGGRRFGAGLDAGDALAKIGGIPTLLFGFGVFLVIFTGFQDAIGRANLERRDAQYNVGKIDHEKEIEAINTRKDLKESDKSDLVKKENDRWTTEEKDLRTRKDTSRYANQQSGYWDKYFLMFGFLFVAFGCVGYLRADSALLLRVVAGVILTAMVLGLLKQATGTAAGVGATLNLG